jgi:IPTL-CTERM motif
MNMNKWMNRATGLPALLATCMVLGGCKHETEVTGNIKDSGGVPKGFVTTRITYSTGTGTVSGTFPSPCGPNSDAQCVYDVTIKGKDANGNPLTVQQTSSITLTCVPGGNYELDCEDPLVVQFPSGVGGIVGTYDNNAGASGALIVQEGLLSVEVDNMVYLTPEAGNHLSIISLPKNLPAGTYDIDLSFDAPALQPITTKAIVTGEVRCGTRTVYPPIVPCTTTMSSVPGVVIPVSAFPVPLLPDLSGASWCTPVITLPCGGGVPAASTWGLIALAGLLAAYGFWRQRSGLSAT